jgi:hypothetical protein
VTTPLAAVLEQTIEGQASDAPLADAVCDLWAKVDDVVCPMFGGSFVAALLDYCLKRERADHPWTDPEGEPAFLDLARLHEAIVRQPSSAATTTAFSVLETFESILAQLVGPELRDRVIESVAEAMTTGRLNADCPDGPTGARPVGARGLRA